MSETVFRSASSRRGFTLVELAIVLAVAALLFAGLWRLASTGSTTMRDQAAADQARELTNAVQGYLASPDGRTVITVLHGAGSGTVRTLPLPAVGQNTNNNACRASLLTISATLPAPLTSHVELLSFCNFLSTGFDAGTMNAYGQTYSIAIRDEGNGNGSFLIVTSGGTSIPDSSGGRIASMIGSSGGFVYTGMDVCNTAAGTTVINLAACGAFGSWAQNIADYAFSASSGHVAARVFTAASGMLDDMALSRLLRGNPMMSAPGGATWAYPANMSNFNTLQTNMALAIPAFHGGGTGAGASIFLMGNIIHGGNGVGSPGTAGLVAFATAGGAIDNIQRAIVQSNFYNDPTLGPISRDTTSPFQVNGCKSLWRANNYLATDLSLPHAGVTDVCPWTLSVVGDASFDGYLWVNMLRASDLIYNPPSDVRLKKDIKTLEGALGKIDQIRPVSFIRKARGYTELGVIAQELEPIYPELIHDDGAGYKTVDYTSLIGPVLAAIKELHAQNIALEHDLKVQKERVEVLEKKLAKKSSRP